MFNQGTNHSAQGIHRAMDGSIESHGRDQGNDHMSAKAMLMNQKEATTPSIKESPFRPPASYLSFPELLMTILDDNEFPTCIKWSSSGESFAMIPGQFSPVLDKHFRGSKIQSFLRKLLRWGFYRAADEGDLDEAHVFCHALFKKGHPEQIANMKPKTAKQKPSKKEVSLGKKAACQQVEKVPHLGNTPQFRGEDPLVRNQLALTGKLETMCKSNAVLAGQINLLAKINQLKARRSADQALVDTYTGLLNNMQHCHQGKEQRSMIPTNLATPTILTDGTLSQKSTLRPTPLPAVQIQLPTSHNSLMALDCEMSMLASQQERKRKLGDMFDNGRCHAQLDSLAGCAVARLLGHTRRSQTSAAEIRAGILLLSQVSSSIPQAPLKKRARSASTNWSIE